MRINSRGCLRNSQQWERSWYVLHLVHAAHLAVARGAGRGDRPLVLRVRLGNVDKRKVRDVCEPLCQRLRMLALQHRTQDMGLVSVLVLEQAAGEVAAPTEELAEGGSADGAGENDQRPLPSSSFSARSFDPTSAP